jgi:RNA polymerase sigma-70 factor, ECF subfamily
MLAEAQPTEVSDETLAAHARAGSRSAFATLMTRYQDRIYRLALRMSRNASDAEEATQETFLHAHRAIGSFQGAALFRTWLYRIAVNEVLMQRRSAMRRPTQSLDALTWAAAEPTARAGGEAAPAADDLAHEKGVAERVREALASLDEPHRAALVLRDLEELSSEEAAYLLGTSPDAVRQRAHRARLRLREALRDLALGTQAHPPRGHGSPRVQSR